MSAAEETVRLGDRIQFSVQLIQQLADEHTLIVVLVAIQVADDGSKILVLQRAE